MKYVSQQLLKTNLVFMVMGKQSETMDQLQMRQHPARSGETNKKATQSCHWVRPVLLLCRRCESCTSSCCCREPGLQAGTWWSCRLLRGRGWDSQTALIHCSAMCPHISDRLPLGLRGLKASFLLSGT